MPNKVTTGKPLHEFEMVGIPFYNSTLFFHSLLVSGSDDLNAILWDPLQCQKKCCIKTGHSGNIFSVKVSHYIAQLYMTNVAVFIKLFIT